MQTTQNISVDWIVKALATGRMAEKVEAGRVLEDKSMSVDRDTVRDTLLRLLREDFSPGRAGREDVEGLGGVRCWLLSALGRVPLEGDEPLRTLKAHTNHASEPNPWARYWALEGLLHLDAKACADICQGVATQDPDVLPKMLALAVLAQGNAPATKKPRTNTSPPSPKRTTATGTSRSTRICRTRGLTCPKSRTANRERPAALPPPTVCRSPLTAHLPPGNFSISKPPPPPLVSATC